MAYVVGLLTVAEKEELERRDWEVEPGPTTLLPDPDKCVRWKEDDDYWVYDYPPVLWCMVWVDTSMFEAMDGPDWQDAGLTRETRDIINKLRVKFDDAGELDEIIHQLKSEEATAINNGGVEEQLRYIAQYGGIGLLRQYFEEHIK